MIDGLMLEDDSDRKNYITVTLVFAVASFLGNFGVIITGFGNALIFLFVYTIADFSGLLDGCGATCDIKEAVFLQSISLASVVPVVLWVSRDLIKKHSNKTLLLAFVPATIIGTPIGNLLQEVVRDEYIRIIVGVLVTLFCCFQIMQFHKQRNLDSTTKGASESHQGVEVGTEHVLSDPEMLPNLQNDEEDTPTPLDKSATARSTPSDESSNSISSLEITEAVEENSDDTSSPWSPHKGIRFWILGFVLGWTAGFLGGLNGVRSGPILMFFLYYRYPKDDIRANLLIVTAVNTYMRVLYYIVDSRRQQQQKDDTQNPAWFEKDIWYLYVSVILAGLIAIPAGLWTEKKIKLGAFNMIIIICLLLTGVMNMVKGSMEIVAN